MSGSTSTRDPSQTPFASDSVFNLPLGLNAQWQSNSQLSSASVFVNTTQSGYTENIYTGTASDPVITVTNTATAGGTPSTYQVHIPADAIAASGGDQTFSVDDTTTGTWYSFGGFNRTGTNTATVRQGSAESDTGSGIADDNSDWDEGVGTLRESDLQAGTIDHMLRVELPTSMLMSYTNSAYQLASYAWPQDQEDGNGPSVYTGTVPYGVTVGIAANAVEPTAIANNAGANMLWHALQDHGAMVRDSGGSGNVATFQADQTVNPNDPLVLGMDQFGSQIMSQVQILTNQGPNSVNGGGTPIVPLDPPASDSGSTAASTPTATATVTATATPTPAPTPTPTPAAATSQTTPTAAASAIITTTSGGSVTDGSGNVWTLTSAGKTIENGAEVGSGSGTAELTGVNGVIWGQAASNSEWYTYSNGVWIAQGSATPPSSATSVTSSAASTATSNGTSASGSVITVAPDEASTTVSVSNVTINATGGDHLIFISGNTDTFNLSGGTETITDSGSGGNTFNLPAAGNGNLVFDAGILGSGNMLNLTTALGATSWDGAAQDLGSYLHTEQVGSNTELLVSATASSSTSGTELATFNNGNVSLSTILGHSTT